MVDKSLVALLQPEWDHMLVRRDANSRQIGIGQGGKALVMPDTAQDIQPCRSGTVIKAGPDSPYAAGQRIAFGARAMTVLEMEGEVRNGEGEETAIGLVASSEVLCTWDASEEELSRPLAVEGAAYAKAPAGFLLVERSELPVGRGRIHMPERYTEAIRSLEATVMSVSDPDGRFQPGDLVLLNSSVGRPVRFGLRGERVLWGALPQQIVGRLNQSLERELRLQDETPLAFRGPLQEPGEVKWDEGDRSAPQ